MKTDSGFALYKFWLLRLKSAFRWKSLRRKRRGVKIKFHRVLLGFFENWDKSTQKKWDKGVYRDELIEGWDEWYNMTVY